MLSSLTTGHQEVLTLLMVLILGIHLTILMMMLLRSIMKYPAHQW